MTTRPRTVDVVVPCHTGEHVAEAIRSALAQDHEPLRVIVVEDGPVPGLASLASRCGPRVRLLSQPRGGPAAARNRALDACDGEFVAFLDSDDRWHPAKIRRQVAFLDAHPECGLVYTARRTIDERGNATAVERARSAAADPPGLTELLFDCHILTSQVLVRRSLLAHERFAPETTPVEDWDLWLRLAARAPFGFVDEPLTDYRKHGGNISRDRRRVFASARLVLERAIRRLPPGPALAAARASRDAVCRRLAGAFATADA